MSQPSIVVQWWKPLYGCIRLWWAKNASYKLMIAALLWSRTSRLLNIPSIRDVRLVQDVISLLWGDAQFVGNKTMYIDPSVTSWTIPNEFGKTSRASAVFIWPLLGKFGKVDIPMPTWDNIGERPLDRLLEWLEAMGATCEAKNNRLRITAEKLTGTTYRFAKNSHTWTEILLMAAVLAEGKTILENAAMEPEIDDMIHFLNWLGAKIRRRAFRTIEIEGVKELGWTIHTVIPDRNTAITYACAAIISKGDVVIENAQHQHLTAFLDKLDEAWWGYEVGDYGIRFFYKWPLRATDIETKPEPGFMTDWQALWAVLMCTAEWTSTIHETVFESRFSHYQDILEKMGGSFETFAPDVMYPEKVYNFNWTPEMKGWHYAIKIHGNKQFTGGEFHLNDLRAWATAILAWMIGTWETILYNIEQVERWYEDIVEKLSQLWANIEKKE